MLTAKLYKRMDGTWGKSAHDLHKELLKHLEAVPRGDRFWRIGLANLEAFQKEFDSLQEVGYLKITLLLPDHVQQARKVVTELLKREDVEEGYVQSEEEINVLYLFLPHKKIAIG